MLTYDVGRHNRPKLASRSLSGRRRRLWSHKLLGNQRQSHRGTARPEHRQSVRESRRTLYLEQPTQRDERWVYIRKQIPRSKANEGIASNGECTSVSHFDGKAEVEEYVRLKGIPSTFVWAGVSLRAILSNAGFAWTDAIAVVYGEYAESLVSGRR